MKIPRCCKSPAGGEPSRRSSYPEKRTSTHTRSSRRSTGGQKLRGAGGPSQALKCPAAPRNPGGVPPVRNSQHTDLEKPVPPRAKVLPRSGLAPGPGPGAVPCLSTSGQSAARPPCLWNLDRRGQRVCCLPAGLPIQRGQCDVVRVSPASLRGRRCENRHRPTPTADFRRRSTGAAVRRCVFCSSLPAVPARAVRRCVLVAGRSADRRGQKMA